MRHYVIYSTSLHIAFFAAVMLIIRNSPIGAPLPAEYTIDFIGPAEGIAEPQSADAVAPPSKQPPATVVARRDYSEIRTGKSVRKSRELPLPSPSILKKTKPPSFSSRDYAENKSAGTPGSGLTTDIRNFPYPWYITQVRAALWDEWSARMPRGGGMLSASLVFRIQRDGSIKKAKTEKGSGNNLFDFAALSAAEQSAPFPPLPDDFREKELTVHVEFRIAE